MDQELLSILACPKCKGPLILAEEGSRLLCDACRLGFRVDDGIPILLIDEAVPT